MFRLLRKFSNWIICGLSPKTSNQNYEPSEMNFEMDPNFVYPDGSQLASFHKEYIEHPKKIDYSEECGEEHE